MNKELFTSVLQIEADALIRAKDKVKDEDLSRLEILFRGLKATGSQLVFCGVGKSGLIGQKLASTFSSLGLPSYFLHPVEALHGDLGRVRGSDAMVFISKSGTTEEILKLLNFLRLEKDQLIALVGNPHSEIAQRCSIVFDCGVEKEACINNLAPTTSSTLALAVGDAMAVFYENIIGLSREGFARNHPGGLLGKSLLLKVEDIMWKSSECPSADRKTPIKSILLKMTSQNVGGLAVIDKNGRLEGIVVEGDIRRAFSDENIGLQSCVELIMNKNPVSVNSREFAYKALELMEGSERSINILPVVDKGIFVGFLRLHDLVREGFSLR